MYFFNLIAREYSYNVLFVCFSVSFIYLSIFILLNNFHSMMTKLIPLASKRIYGLMVYHLSFIMMFFFVFFFVCYKSAEHSNVFYIVYIECITVTYLRVLVLLC
jgi:hypothetical protein